MSTQNELSDFARKAIEIAGSEAKLIWWHCYREAEAIFEGSSVKDVARMLLDGIKAATLEDAVASLDFYDTEEEVLSDIATFFKGD